MVSEDTRGVLLAQLVPGGVALIGAVVHTLDRDAITWWKGLKKPSWAPSDIRCYMATDILLTLPMGCAAYLVYKHGGGFDDAETKTALGLYGATHGAMLVAVCQPLTKNLKLMFPMTLLTAGLVSATCYAFYRLHQPSGIMMMPITAWMWFYVALHKSVIDLNEKDE